MQEQTHIETAQAKVDKDKTTKTVLIVVLGCFLLIAAVPVCALILGMLTGFVSFLS